MRSVTAALSVAMMLVGIAIVARTLAGGGGALAAGVLMGILFCAAGAGRLWAERRRP